jgi:hypothetical protein
MIRMPDVHSNISITAKLGVSIVNFQVLEALWL